MTNTFYLIMQIISTALMISYFIFLFLRKEKTKDLYKKMFTLSVVIVILEMAIVIINLLLGEYLNLLLEGPLCIAWIAYAKLGYDKIKEY